MASKKDISKKEAIEAGIGLGAMSQLSRSGRIRQAGGLFLLFSLVAYIGEGLMWLLKWLVLKPGVAIAKGVVRFFIWSFKMTWYLFKWMFWVLPIKAYHYIKTKRSNRISG